MSKKLYGKDQPPSTNPNDDIAQPDPNSEDSQGYIKENAKKGQPVSVPNVIGPNPVTEKIAPDEQATEKAEKK